MISVIELADREVVWNIGEPPHWASVLRADGEVVGSLRCEAESRAIGELEGRAWLFQREGPLLRPRIVVRCQGSPEPVATFTPGWTGGGVVEFRSGIRYCWNPSHIWSTTYCFRRESKNAAVCIAQGPTSRNGPRVKICAEAAGHPETPILVLLGGLLEIMHLKRLMNLAEV